MKFKNVTVAYTIYYFLVAAIMATAAIIAINLALTLTPWFWVGVLILGYWTLGSLFAAIMSIVFRKAMEKGDVEW